jgi:hypothetical protein
MRLDAGSDESAHGAAGRTIRGAPGFAQDMQFALEAEKTRVVKKRADAAQEAADTALYNPWKPPQSSFVCTAEQFGSVIQADCH